MCLDNYRDDVKTIDFKINYPSKEGGDHFDVEYHGLYQWFLYVFEKINRPLITITLVLKMNTNATTSTLSVSSYT